MRIGGTFVAKRMPKPVYENKIYRNRFYSMYKSGWILAVIIINKKKKKVMKIIIMGTLIAIASAMNLNRSHMKICTTDSDCSTDQYCKKVGVRKVCFDND